MAGMDENPYRAPEGDLTPPSMRPQSEKRFPLLAFVGLIGGMVFGALITPSIEPPGWIESAKGPVFICGFLGLAVGAAFDAWRNARK